MAKSMFRSSITKRGRVKLHKEQNIGQFTMGLSGSDIIRMWLVAIVMHLPTLITTQF